MTQEDSEKLNNEELATLKAAFDHAMKELYLERKEPPLKYYASRLLSMLRERNWDGVKTAKDILWGPGETSSGLQRLWEAGRLDLSVQALVLQKEFAPLFIPEDRQKAHDTLCDHDFRVAWDLNPCRFAHCKCVTNMLQKH